MAYGNWGGFAYRNGLRVRDHEDTRVFPDSTNEAGEQHHIFLGDGPVRLSVWKHLPLLWVKRGAADPEQVDIEPFRTNAADKADGTWAGEVEGARFTARQYHGNMADVFLVEADGTIWNGTCGYEFGSGFMDEDD